MSARRPALRSAALAFICLLVAIVVPAAAQAAGDIGAKSNFLFDKDATGVDSGGFSITGSKPESKLWFNDGIWWGDIARAGGPHTINRLDATDQWQDTGTALDSRFKTVSDTISDGSRLYVASHSYTSQSAAATTGTDGKFYRYSYDAGAKKYTLEAGFPVTIPSPKTETLVIAKDAAGLMWATWTAAQKVWVTRTSAPVASGAVTWITPYAISGAAKLDVDDISSIVAFGNQVGVMWSQQDKAVKPYGGHMYFATHNAGDTSTSWSAAQVNTGWSPDDHISLKADGQGNVYAAVKTSEGSSNPLTLLLKRSTGGTWGSSVVFGLATDSHTRPIVMLDEQDGRVHMLATCPQPPSKSGQSGGDICEKTASMTSPSFGPGVGTAILSDSTSKNMNDVTSTKQNVSPATGLVVLANDKDTNRYWTSDRSLPLSGANPGPAALTADFTYAPSSTSTPLTVNFNATTNAAAATYAWNFGDGQTGTGATPSHAYANAGTYQVALTVTRTSDGTQKPVQKSITVSAAGGGNPGGGSGATLIPSADTFVKMGSSKANGSATTLQVRQGTSSSTSTSRSYLKFDVPPSVTGAHSAKLRLWVTDASTSGGAVYTVPSSWSELTFAWNSQTAAGFLGNVMTPTGTPIAQVGNAPAGAWVEVPLGNVINGGGSYSFAIAAGNTNTVIYSSRESGANAPQLVVAP